MHPAALNTKKEVLSSVERRIHTILEKSEVGKIALQLSDTNTLLPSRRSTQTCEANFRVKQ